MPTSNTGKNFNHYLNLKKMKDNWLLICTSRNKEKNVVKALTKKGIENYCPYTTTSVKVTGSKHQNQSLPLFNQCVFVKQANHSINEMLNIQGVQNLVYWKSAPVKISEETVYIIKQMEENYSKIELQKIDINPLMPADFTEESIVSKENNAVAIKHKGMSAVLPVLGYRLTVKREDLNQTAPAIKKPAATTSSVLQRLNALFFFNF
ncbi:MAG: hypothetical protein RL172_1130 [Bacteroidota bacterium]|jgi:transcription antitermination factor NusG